MARIDVRERSVGSLLVAAGLVIVSLAIVLIYGAFSASNQRPSGWQAWRAEECNIAVDWDGVTTEDRGRGDSTVWLYPYADGSGRLVGVVDGGDRWVDTYCDYHGIPASEYFKQKYREVMGEEYYG